MQVDRFLKLKLKYTNIQPVYVVLHTRGVTCVSDVTERYVTQLCLNAAARSALGGSSVKDGHGLTYHRLHERSVTTVEVTLHTVFGLLRRMMVICVMRR